jgi:predicted RND superfamily exporter protein
VVARHDRPDFRIHMAGGLVLEDRLNEEMQNDVKVFMGMAVGLILVVLYIVFRRISGVFLSLVVVALALGSTMGMMALLDVPLSLTTEILPPFLLAVGVCDAVHILAIFYQQLGRGVTREDAIAFSLRHCGLAVLMTSLTTAGGLMSFYAAEVAPISQLGFIAPLGVMLALVYSVVLLPALLAVVPLRPARAAPLTRNIPLQRLLHGCGVLAIRRPWPVAGVWALALLLSALGASRLRFSQDELLWFPEDEPIRQATALIDRDLKGVMSLEVVLDTGAENGLHSPALLRKIEKVYLANGSVKQGALFIGKTTSVIDILKETHQALNENRSRFYAIPDSRQLVAQELLLFENSGSDDLEELVDTQFRQARISMKVPWVDSMLYPAFLEKIETQFETLLGDGAQIRVTGLSALLSRMFSNLIVTMGRSYLLAFTIITPLMILLLGSFRRGFLSMVPNLAPVIAILGIMGWSNVPLDITSILVGGIIISLAVDDTIHFMHGFNRIYRETADPERAIHETLQTTGGAMLFTSVVLSAGFFIFVLGYMKNVSTFGALAGFATIMAFLADVTLAPALMILVTRNRSDGGIRAPALVESSSPREKILSSRTRSARGS